MTTKIHFTVAPTIMPEDHPLMGNEHYTPPGAHRVFRVRDTDRACYNPGDYGSGFVSPNTKAMHLQAAANLEITQVHLRHSSWHQMVSMICFYFLGDIPETISDDPKLWAHLPMSGLAVHSSFSGVILPEGVSKLAEDITRLREDGQEQKFIDVLEAMPNSVIGQLYPRISDGILLAARTGGAMVIF